MSSSLATTTQQQQQLFDYDQLEAIHRDPIQRAEVEITTLFNRSVRNFIKIGQKLREVHHRFPTVELFTAWFQAKFAGSQRTAYNLMKLAERFSDVSEDVIANIGLSTLYDLASASVPDSARQAALQLAGDGHQVTSEVADALIEQARQEEETAQGSLFEAEIEAAEPVEAPKPFVSPVKLDTRAYCLCEHPQDDHDEGASNCKFCNCECFEDERVDRSNVETLAEVTETTTTKTKTIVEAAPVAPAEPAPVKGEGDILFEQATINLAITMFPLKGDDRDCMIWLKSGDISVQRFCKESQIADALANFTLSQQLLALKQQLLDNDAAKKAKTPVTTAKASTKTAAKSSTTKTTKTKGTK